VSGCCLLSRLLWTAHTAHSLSWLLIARRPSNMLQVACLLIQTADCMHGGGDLSHVDMCAHNKSGVAYQDRNQRPETAVNHNRGPISSRGCYQVGGCYQYMCIHLCC
jgi:hypothetical protein